MNVCLLDEQFK